MWCSAEVAILAVFIKCKIICLRGYNGELRGQHKLLKIIIVKLSQREYMASFLVHTKVGINYLQYLNWPQMEAWALYNAVWIVIYPLEQWNLNNTVTVDLNKI